MGYSDAIRWFIDEIQKANQYAEVYEMMLMTFIEHVENDETVRMAFELAKAELTK